MLRRDSKYAIVGERLGAISGTLMDIGARDRRLQEYLPQGIRYQSADVSFDEGCRWNLEHPLPASDRAYDVVVALDVLEHVDRIHQAYRELLRIARRKLFVSLPNMTCLSHRIWFLLTGRLGTKCDLPPIDPGDRHRWLTGYAQMSAFVGENARAAGFTVDHFDLVAGYDRLHRWICALPLSPELKAYTVLYEMTRGE